MNIIRHIALASLLLGPPAHSQNVSEEAPEDPIQKAIREFNQRDRSSPNGVTVVLDPPAADPSSADAPAKSESPPVLVTGRPPQDTEVVVDHDPAPQEDSALAPGPPPEPRKGLAVRVEKLQSGTGNIDPAQIKLLAPFPAKALSTAPVGWKIEASEQAPSFQREVELAPGRTITLNIRPHLLVPEADGHNTLSVSEPGFNHSLGYRQDSTVGAVLSRSIRQLDEDSGNLGTAIDNLQQLLVSLPKSGTSAEEVPAPPATGPKPANKR